MTMMLNKIVNKVGKAAGALCAIVISSPVQGGLLIINYFILRSALKALNRARFAASVRVIKDLRTEEDLRYLLGRLPPWVTNCDWERGDAVQVLLSLLWPAINSTVCAILRRELEERVQESSDFGHIAFSRLSFGKHPPVIVGIKAVPLHGEDLLAMVLDVDIRWAGEPDVALHLTKLGGASLGLNNVHLAGVVRLVFSPITEDPPFLRRMAVSLLNRPYVDFSVRALGGPDLMALPAISSWLHSVVLNLADRAIVWPKEVGVPLAPPPASEAREEAAAEASALLPPMGILVVRILSADIEPRRSTFLGRIKVPSPRVSLVLPEATGPDGADEGVMQAGLTPVREKTLAPEWNSQFHFVVSRPTQQLRLLVSHKRMELLGADMPLGLADLPLEDILADYDAMQAQKQREQAECIVLDALNAAKDQLTTMATGEGNTTAAAAAAAVAIVDNSGLMTTPPRRRTTSTSNYNTFNSIEREQQQQQRESRRQRSPSLLIPPSAFPNGRGGGFITNNSIRSINNKDNGSPSLSYDDANDSGFDSATSSPVRSRSLSPSLSINSARWASPATSLSIPAEIYHQPSGAIGSGGGVGAPPMAVRTRSVQVHWPASITQAMEASGALNMNATMINSITTNTEKGHVGLGVALATATSTLPTAFGSGSQQQQQQQQHWGPAHASSSFKAAAGVHTTPLSSQKYNSTAYTSTLRPSSSRKLPTATENNAAEIDANDDASETPASWVSPDGIWISIPSTTSVTMAGLVSNAVDTRNTSMGNNGGELGRMASSIGDQMQSQGWLKSIQSMVFGMNREYDDVVADHEDVDVASAAREEGQERVSGGGGAQGGGGGSSGQGESIGGGTTSNNNAENNEGPSKSAGRVRLVVQWLPVATADAVAAAAEAVAAAEAEAAALKKKKKKEKKNTSNGAGDDAEKQKEFTKKASGRSGALDSTIDDDEENISITTTAPSVPASEVVKALTFQDPSIASSSRPASDAGSLANLEAAAAAAAAAGGGTGNGTGSPSAGAAASTTGSVPTAATVAAAAAAANNVVGGVSPRPPPTSVLSKPGILAIRIAYTKLDYGDSPGNPILALSIGSNAASNISSVAAAAAAAALAPPDRMVCMDCQAGGRPGLLHWGRVFHLPVWDPLASRALLELGDAVSGLKLSTYGAELYALDACADFDADVSVEAAASIPLKDVVTRGVVRGSWRLREARGRRGSTVAVAAGGEHEQLDVGRVALVMAWFPLA